MSLLRNALQKKTKVKTVGMIEITTLTQTLNHWNNNKVKLSIMKFRKEIFFLHDFRRIQQIDLIYPNLW